MAVSRYCIAKRVRGHVVAMSLLTGKCLLIDGKLWDNIIAGVTGCNDPDVVKLLTAGVLIPSDIDEFTLATTMYHMQRTDTRRACVDLVLTKACNMSCPYCILGRGVPADRMSSEVASRAVSWMASMCEQVWGAKELDVTFRGGEPLLELGTLETIAVATTETVRLPVVFNVFSRGAR